MSVTLFAVKLKTRLEYKQKTLRYAERFWSC